MRRYTATNYINSKMLIPASVRITGTISVPVLVPAENFGFGPFTNVL